MPAQSWAHRALSNAGRRGSGEGERWREAVAGLRLRVRGGSDTERRRLGSLLGAAWFPAAGHLYPPKGIPEGGFHRTEWEALHPTWGEIPIFGRASGRVPQNLTLTSPSCARIGVLPRAPTGGLRSGRSSTAGQQARHSGCSTCGHLPGNDTRHRPWDSPRTTDDQTPADGHGWRGHA